MVLVLELTTTRLYAYVGGVHATSTALAVAMLGLGVGALARARWPRALAPGRAVPALAGALLALASAVVAGASLAILVAVSLAPLGLAGALIAGAYAACGPGRARAAYAVDLLAAAAGCLAAPRLLGPLAPHEIVAALGLACCALAPAVGARRLVAAGLAVPLAAALLAGRAGGLPDGPLAALLRSGLGDEKALVGAAAEDVRDSAWSPLGRLDVHEAPADRGVTMGVFTDGMSPTYLVEEAHARAGTFAASWGLLMGLPYRALRPARVLVLGAGAGASVWLALRHGATAVDAVEVNPALPGLLARWRGFAGDVYGQPGVRLFVEDARRHLARSTERYDLVELALALTGNLHAQPSGMEAYLYTVEAVEAYLRRLTPTGALVLVHADPGNAYRQLRTVLAALARRGVGTAAALERLAVLRDPSPGTAYRYLLVVSPAPLPLEVVERLHVGRTELLWGPGDPLDRAARLLDPSTLGATDADDLRPVRDDRPYFFQNARGWWATARGQPGRLWALAAALALALALALAPPRAPGVARPAATAAVLGAAFLAAELALIQRLTLAAGGPLQAISLVLCGLLAATGLGALAVGERWRRHPRGLAAACVVAALAVAATAALARDLGWLDALPGDAARWAWLAAVLAPLGLALGAPFPALLAQHGGSEERVARLWAINGAGAAAGGIGAALALRVVGAADTLGLAAALYLVAAVLAPARPRE